MSKNEIGKEVILALLTLIAIMLVVFALLYGFSPMNKIVPEEITYVTSEEVKAEIQPIAEEKLEDKSYELGQNELYTYQATNDYRPGKVNPFSTYKVVENQEGEDESSDGTTKDSTAGNSNSSSGSKSSGGSSTVNVDRSKPIAPGEVNPGNYTKNKGLK